MGSLAVITILSRDRCLAIGIGYSLLSMMEGVVGAGGTILLNWIGGDWR